MCLTKLCDFGAFFNCGEAVGGPETVCVFTDFVDFALTLVSSFLSAYAVEASNKIVP